MVGSCEFFAGAFGSGCGESRRHCDIRLNGFRERIRKSRVDDIVCKWIAEQECRGKLCSALPAPSLRHCFSIPQYSGPRLELFKQLDICPQSPILPTPTELRYFDLHNYFNLNYTISRWYFLTSYPVHRNSELTNSTGIPRILRRRRSSSYVQYAAKRRNACSQEIR